MDGHGKFKSIPGGDNSRQNARERQEHKKRQKRQKTEELAKNSLYTREASQKEEVPVEKKENIPSKDGRRYTVSLALPGSIIDNAQSAELRTYLAGQIGRALALFQVDEIVIFQDPDSISKGDDDIEGSFGGAKRPTDPCVFLARLLQYLETPQYLRRAFFPMHPDLKLAGLLNPLDTPHHMRYEDNTPYREGITVNRPVKPGQGSLVDCGLMKVSTDDMQLEEWSWVQQVRIDKELQAGLRVTVEMMNSPGDQGKVLKGSVVAPSAPREEKGLYWGYTVRIARNLADMFTDSPYEGGYDYTIGCDEQGDSVDDFVLPPFKHILVVLGGLTGLEATVEHDSTLQAGEPREIFDAYLNTCMSKGTRTIRTEEALLVTMSVLRSRIAASGALGTQ